jgi:hypothetical protein
MKKITLVLLILIFLITGIPSNNQVYGQSPQILRNPGFEQDIEYWQSAVTTTLIALDSYQGINPQSGEYFMYSGNRYGYADGPMQRIENQLNHYGPGSYQIGAHMRLSPDSTSSSIRARVLIRLVSTDKSSGSAQYPGNYWYTTTEVTINKTSWTLVQSTVDVTWSQNLELAEFYFMNNAADPAVDLCIDNANLIRTDYTGNPYVFPSPTAVLTPTIPPAVTVSPTAMPPSPSPTVPATPSVTSAAPTATPAITLAPTATLTPVPTASPATGEPGSEPESSSADSEISLVPTEDLSSDGSSESYSESVSDTDKPAASKRKSVMLVVGLLIVLVSAALLGVNLKAKRSM